MKIEYLGFLPMIVLIIWGWTGSVDPEDMDFLQFIFKLGIRVITSIAIFGLILGLFILAFETFVNSLN